MARKNISQDEFKLLPEHKEHPCGVSLTVPDETLSIKQIVDKHVRGQEIADQLMRQPLYDSGIYGDDRDSDFDSEDLEKVVQMDLAEKDELKASNKQKIADMQAKQKLFLEEKKKKQKAADEGTRGDRGSSGDERPTPRAREFSRNDDEDDAQQSRPKNEQKKPTRKEDENSTTLT